MRTNFDKYLKTFFEVELNWIADADWQRKSWEHAQEEMFGEFLMIIFQSWSVIEENRHNFKLTDPQFKQVQKLFEMIESFQNTIDYPESPSDHLALLNNQGWQKIQRYAQETIDIISPTLV